MLSKITNKYYSLYIKHITPYIFTTSVIGANIGSFYTTENDKYNKNINTRLFIKNIFVYGVGGLMFGLTSPVLLPVVVLTTPGYLLSKIKYYL